ncbi:CitMHS family transporter [Caproiciproducens faecalis]|uniref:Citrate transporter n=1 Tax=Caproiciproducens faecalis TaxID=2820301 RepID=A0ABS7DQ23_9FIRM|nr:citrate:proton symporter [Caproiciproducens faecalis]MBW7573201.1 citrate transporter [Caproiciproducens faecalis]
MYITVVGIIMLVVFMTLILTKRTSALTALILVPIVFGFIAGYGTNTFVYAMKGIIGVGTTISMLVFAILYFGIMLCTGLFDPLGNIVQRFFKGDPFRVVLGTAILAALVSLDGDGTTTIMICCAMLMPVYAKLKINPVYLAIFIIMPNGVINLLPWGGPTARLMAVAKLDATVLLRGLLPLMVAGLLSSFAMAAYVGLKERKRLGIAADFVANDVECSSEESALRRPKYIWFNLVLTVLALVSIIALGIPGPLVFAIASSIALIVNYRNLKDESKVVSHNAQGIVNVVLMILGAGILMGVLSESGMATAMAERLISIIPESWGNMFNLLVAVISGPAVWILNNDAFYFGLYPVLAETATAYGFTATQVGLASLMGQALRGFSPVIPALYFLTTYVDVDFSEFQKKMIPFCLIMFALYIATGFLMNIYFLA